MHKSIKLIQSNLSYFTDLILTSSRQDSDVLFAAGISGFLLFLLLSFAVSWVIHIYILEHCRSSQNIKLYLWYENKKYSNYITIMA